MLWYKGWLETRIKLLASVGMMLFMLTEIHFASFGGTMASKTGAAVGLGNTLLVAMACIWLAGAGIVTQPAFQAVKGIHGSTLFTLALPVSRLRLLAVRAGLGWLLTAGWIATLCVGLVWVSPALRAAVRPADMVAYGMTLLACGSAFYFLCVLLATFLEDQWRMIGGMVSIIGLGWLSNHVKLPGFADLYLAMGKGSPLLTHSLPWSTMGFSVGLSIFLFLVALKIVRVREY